MEDNKIIQLTYKRERKNMESKELDEMQNRPYITEDNIVKYEEQFIQAQNDGSTTIVKNWRRKNQGLVVDSNTWLKGIENSTDDNFNVADFLGGDIH